MRLHVLTTPQGLIRSSIGAVQRPTARSESRGYMWLSSKISSALMVNQGSTTFYVLIWWQQLGIATIISRAGYLMSSVSTRLCTHGAPASCLSGTLESGLHMMGQSTLRIQLTVGTSVDQGRGRGTGWLWIRYPKERGVGKEPHFLLTPSSMSVTSAVDWATIHALAIGRLVRCDFWLFSLFHIYRIHSLFYAYLNLCL